MKYIFNFDYVNVYNYIYIYIYLDYINVYSMILMKLKIQVVVIFQWLAGKQPHEIHKSKVRENDEKSFTLSFVKKIEKLCSNIIQNGFFSF